MSGCFGSHPVDRWMEGQLNAYLDSQEVPTVCEDCPLLDDCECTPDDCETDDLKGDSHG